mmetsp:Transcript_42167/g.101424  ORF Transcript_42167/g.101424 Transcript_42167/m.101424 type:complete len:216 (-) Transcript_42167:457-1104(-)
MDDLSDEIGADIGSFGVDTTTDTSEHSNDGSTQTVSCQGFREEDPFLRGRVVQPEDKHGTVQHQKTETTEGEAHDGTGTEGGVETCGPARLLGRDGSTDVGIDGNFHSKVSRRHRREGTQQEGQGRHETTCHVPTGTPRNKDEDEDTESNDEPEADSIFCLQERLGAFIDCLVDFLETCRNSLVVTGRDKTLFLTAPSTGPDGDFRNDQELSKGP